jgi:hypothetical protein
MNLFKKRAKSTVKNIIKIEIDNKDTSNADISININPNNIKAIIGLIIALDTAKAEIIKKCPLSETFLPLFDSKVESRKEVEIEHLPKGLSEKIAENTLKNINEE